MAFMIFPTTRWSKPLMAVFALIALVSSFGVRPCSARKHRSSLHRPPSITRRLLGLRRPQCLRAAAFGEYRGVY